MKRLRHLRSALLVAVSLGLLTSPVRGQPGDVTLDRALNDLEAYKREVVAARESAQAQFDHLAATMAGNAQARALLRRALGPSLSAADPMIGLYAGQLTEIDTWLGLLQNHGSMDRPFMDRAATAMGRWRARQSNFIRLLSPLSSRLAELPSDRGLEHCRGSETSICNEARHRQRDREAAVEHIAGDVDSRLRAAAIGATLDGPAPSAVACTNERPAAIRIDPGRNSAVVEEYIQVRVTVISRSQKGAVVATDADVDVEVTNGTVVAADPEAPVDAGRPGTSRTTVRIRQGTCSGPAKVTSKNAGETQIRAKRRDLTPAQRSVGFCTTTRVASLMLSMDRAGRGVADGVTPIPFSYKFFDANNQLTTGKVRKELGITHRGVGERAGHAPGTKTDSVPADQCVSQQDLTSKDVGETTIEARYGSLQAQPSGQFAFYFPLTLRSGLWVTGFALMGSVLIAVGRRPRPGTVIGTLLLLLIGVAIGLVGAGGTYYLLLRFMPQPSPAIMWLLLLCLGGLFVALLGLPFVKRILLRLAG